MANRLSLDPPVYSLTTDRRPIAAAKNLINQVSLPSADRLLDGLNSFLTALTWPETQQRGLQQDSDFEKRWPEFLGSLLERAEHTKD